MPRRGRQAGGALDARGAAELADAEAALAMLIARAERLDRARAAKKQARPIGIRGRVYTLPDPM
jgi:hypothetical protein